MPWPNPALTEKQSADLALIMDEQTTSEDAAKLLDTNPSQADAYRRYVILVCVLQLRRSLSIPHDHQEKAARALMRAMAPAMRNRLPDALRWGAQP